MYITNALIFILQGETPDDLDACSEQPSVQLNEEEKREKRLEQGVGVINIVVDCNTEIQGSNMDALSSRVAESPRLPSTQEVILCGILSAYNKLFTLVCCL